MTRVPVTNRGAFAVRIVRCLLGWAFAVRRMAYVLRAETTGSGSHTAPSFAVAGLAGAFGVVRPVRQAKLGRRRPLEAETVCRPRRGTLARLGVLGRGQGAE